MQTHCQPIVLSFNSVPRGESPPPPPRACFGRDELIEKIVGLANNLNPIALTGAGGIGKTSIALTVLHRDCIKNRFGDNRHFIRCDEFPPSRTNFLNRLSKAIGAGVDNPENLTPLRRSLSSKEIFLILDNGESILDPQGADGKEIYALVEELSRFNNICLIITSRITTIPPDCKRLDVPQLTIDAARSTFYRIYENDEQPEVIDNILRQLDFHPLCVALLATVAHQSNWDNSRLAREWEKRHTGVLRTEHNTSLAAAIELSLASPMFKELGPGAREVLEVVSFFPQGVDEDKLEWLFPAISHRNTIFDRFCTLSLAYRANGFVTMLAPLRDHLSPRNPAQSPLLCAVKKLYFIRLSVDVGPGAPGFDGARWIMSEDVNVEHLLDVFTSIDSNSDDIWKICAGFMEHLYWHKPRLVVLQSKIEQLPDDYHSKPRCLFRLSWLFQRVGNWMERKRLLTHASKLYRERGDDDLVAATLQALSDANRMLGLCEEGIRQVEEALDIWERLGDTVRQALCLIDLAQLLYDDDQLGAAEDAVSRTINLVPEEGEEYLLSRSHRLLGDICRSNGDGKEAVHHYKEAIQIASLGGWYDHLFWIYFSLAELSQDEEKFDGAHAHIKQAKLHAVDNGYYLGRAAEMDAWIWYRQRMFDDAASEALHAIELYEKVGSAEDVADCRALLGEIEQATGSRKGTPPL